MVHECHADNCDDPISPRLLMCKKHWRLVPEKFKHRVHKHYRGGQEVDKNPTENYLKAARDCIDYVAVVEAGQRQIDEDNK